MVWLIAAVYTPGSSAAKACTLIAARATRTLKAMRSRFAVRVAVAITAFGTAGCAYRSSARVVDLHRLVFATINPGHPQTRAGAEAQMDLARAYAKGRGTER